jgi:transcriptional regulator GlxA family with amidase domain
MLRNVAVFIADGQHAFELGVVCEVFGLDRTSEGIPNFDFAVCSLKPGAIRTNAGFEIRTKHGIDRLATADLIAIPAWRDINERPPDALIQALNDAVQRGSRVMSVCSGAFVLAAAGLLDGRPATTHWMYADALAMRYPSIKVNRNVLYIDDGEVLTSAGTAAGIDLCLHIVRQAFGAAVANKVARRMVIAPHRDGGQAQFIETPMGDLAPGQDLQPVLNWALEHLDAARTCRHEPSREDSPPSPEPLRTNGWWRNVPLSQNACLKRPTTALSLWHSGQALAVRPPCAITSRGVAAPHLAHTGKPFATRADNRAGVLSLFWQLECAFRPRHRHQVSASAQHVCKPTPRTQRCVW